MIRKTDTIAAWRRLGTGAAALLLLAFAIGCAPVAGNGVITVPQDGPAVFPGDPCNGVVPDLCPR